jgi:hypothetical protein
VDSPCRGGGALGVIFLFWSFLKKKILEMNPTETYFQDLALLSHASPVSTTNEGVAPCALTQPMARECGLVSTWSHVA